MTVFDDAAEVLFEIWPEAVAASFVPSSGPVVTGFNVIVQKSLRFLPEGFDAQTWGDSVTIEYLLDQVGREARVGEKFTVGVTTYTVAAPLENDGRFVKVVAR